MYKKCTILCLSCNIKKSKTTAKLSKNSWNKRRSNRFQWHHLWRQRLYCYSFFIALYMNQYHTCLWGPWLNNTEVYLTHSKSHNCRINWILTWRPLSLCEQTTDLSIRYHFIGTCASGCDWLFRCKCTCW